MQKTENIKIVFTGGHAVSTALVVANEIKRENKEWEIFWIGLKNAIEGKNQKSLATMFFPKYGIKTFEITSGRIQTKLTKYTIPSLLKIPVGFFHSYKILREIKPNVVLSFGGFSAFPVVVMSYFMRIPVIIHEQTSVVGRANRFSAIFAEKIAISRETSLKYFPEDKTVLTGNPTPYEFFNIKNPSKNKKTKQVLVTGGQSGSVAINNVVESCLDEILTKFKLIHLTGKNDEMKFKKIRAGLSLALRKNYEVYGIVDPDLYNKIFNSSDIVISRSGANTISKIVASKKKCILIPLPISYLNEQQKNAEFAAKYTDAEIVKQSELEKERLLKSLSNLSSSSNTKNKTQGYKNPDNTAAHTLVKLIENYI